MKVQDRRGYAKAELFQNGYKYQRAVSDGISGDHQKYQLENCSHAHKTLEVFRMSHRRGIIMADRVLSKIVRHESEQAIDPCDQKRIPCEFHNLLRALKKNISPSNCQTADWYGVHCSLSVAIKAINCALCRRLFRL